MKNWTFAWILLLVIGIPTYAQEPDYTLFVGEFGDRTGIGNPLLLYLNDTLDFLFSRSELAEIHTISPGLRSAYLQMARNQQPNADITQLTLLAAEYAKANAILMGSYGKEGPQWFMEAQLYVMRGEGQAREDIRLVGEDMYHLLDDLAAEVGRRLGTGQYTLLSTSSWEAYEAYRRGHQAYYNFDMMGAIGHFQRAIELDPQMAVAHAELGVSYLGLNDVKKAGKAIAEIPKNLQNTSEQERSVVLGLQAYYEQYASRATYDMPRMREDMVWDEPWLQWYAMSARKRAGARITNREFKLWLDSAVAYADAGFYGAPELVYIGLGSETSQSEAGRCMIAFDATKDPQFLEAALQFIERAAVLEADDEYDDAWKYWEFAAIYDRMEQPTDVQKHREKWFQAIKSKPTEDFPSRTLNDIARRCMDIGSPRDALRFAGRAVDLESDPGIRATHLVTVAAIYLDLRELGEAFGLYLDAFETFARGDAGTDVLADSLRGLTDLMRSNPEFVDEAKRAELDEIMKVIENMDPLLFRQDVSSLSGSVFESTRDFCLELGDIGLVLKLVRGLLKAETDPLEQFSLLSYLASSGGNLTESELALLEKILKEEKSPSLRLKCKYTLFSLYQMAGKYDEAEALVHGDIILEAEDAVSITPRLRVEEDRNASNGKYITGSPDTSGEPVGEAEYTFQVSKPGDYKVLGRVLAPDDDADKFFVSMDDGEKHIWDVAVYDADKTAWDVTVHSRNWVWSVVTRRKPGGLAGDDNVVNLTYNLTAGQHTLRIGNREDSTKLDMIVIAPLQGE